MRHIVFLFDPTTWKVAMRAAIERAGFVVPQRRPGETAAQLLHRRPPDQIVLVDHRPQLDAVLLLPWLKRSTPALVTVVTDPADEQRLLQAFSAGADDVVPRDCSPDLFVTRLRTLLRRRSGALPAPSRQLAIGDVIIEQDRARVHVRGRLMHLTSREFAVLSALMRDPGVVYGRAELLSLVWGSRDAVSPHTVDVYIARLRRKVEPAGGHGSHIISVARHGYRFRRPDERPAAQGARVPVPAS